MSDALKPIPPARIAGRAGDSNYVPDWDPGRQTQSGAPPQVVPVMQRSIDVAAPVMVEGITIKPAKLMEPAEARNTLARIVNDMLVWLDGYPFELTGEEAYVLKIFQEIQARRQARVQATAHDQTIEPDEVDQASFKPDAT